MDLLIGWKSFKRKIEGVMISYELRPLKRDAFLALIPYITDAQNIKQDLANMKKEKIADKFGMLAEKCFKLQAVVEPFIEEHVRNLEGIKLDNEKISPIRLAQEAILSNICTIIVGDLFSISTINQDKEKNLKKQSDS